MAGRCALWGCVILVLSCQDDQSCWTAQEGLGSHGSWQDAQAQLGCLTALQSHAANQHPQPTRPQHCLDALAMPATLTQKLQQEQEQHPVVRMHTTEAASVWQQHQAVHGLRKLRALMADMS